MCPRVRLIQICLSVHNEFPHHTARDKGGFAYTIDYSFAG